MTHVRAYLFALALCTFLFCPAVGAHHSFSAEFDFEKPVTLHGTVTKWEMINPHCRILLDVKNPDGTVSQWNILMGAPSFLYRSGWRKDSVKPGQELTVEGYHAKDGTNTAYGQQAHLADGRRVLGGPLVTDAQGTTSDR
jgi:hypothetical protein